MKLVAGAILILAGVIPLSFGLMLAHADWYHQPSIPLVLQVCGEVCIAVGVGLLFWGLARSGAEFNGD